MAAARLLAAVVDARTPLDGLTDHEHGHPQFRALDPRDRALVMLADAEGWTAPEIASHVGMTAEAVRTRLSRAHRKLRELLSDLA